MTVPARPAGPHVLLVDLNNFARFPTLSIGSLAAVLRSAGHRVEVLSPLAHGVRGLPRSERARAWSYWDERLRWWSATTPSVPVRMARGWLSTFRPHRLGARGEKMRRAFRAALERDPRVVLVSTYLMYFDAVRALASEARTAGVPLVVGGPAFHDERTRDAWRRLPGVTAVFAGEGEAAVVEVVAAAASDRGVDPVGMTRADGPDRGLAPPLDDLDGLPIPDYSDFPWDRYPRPIAPVLTGRGCGWARCTFCSDIVTVAGRGFRTRTCEGVLEELSFLHRRYGASLFCFSDLKLNSDLSMWRGLHEGFQAAVPGASWTCAVHLGPREDEGLSTADLRAARAAGLARITTGLETGSRRLSNAMRKGTSPEGLADFLARSHELGISTRVTAFTGHPRETAADLEETARFLARSGRWIDRVHLSRLSMEGGAALEQEFERGDHADSAIRLQAHDSTQGRTPHVDERSRSRSYRRALADVLGAVHRINRTPLPPEARSLEGAM